MSIIEWLWQFLPDKCQGTNCKRRGVRGNENVVGMGLTLCDDCHADMMRAQRSQRECGPYAASGQ